MSEVPAHLRIQRPLGAADQEGLSAWTPPRRTAPSSPSCATTCCALEDEVVCKTCGKKFEIPSQQSLLFVDQLAGLPNEEELEREIAAASGEPGSTAA